MNFVLPHDARSASERLARLLEEMGAPQSESQLMAEQFGWSVEQPFSEIERWINENGGGDVTELEARLAVVEAGIVTVEGNVVTLGSGVTMAMETIGIVQGSVMVLGERVDTVDVSINDILNNLIPNTIRVGTVHSIGAASIMVRVSPTEIVEATEWFVPVTPVLNERIVIGRSGGGWVIISTFEVDPPVVSFTTTSFTVFEPSNPAVEKWQIRYHRDGEAWTEGAEITPTTGNDDLLVSGLTAGQYEVEIRFDLVGPTGFDRWSASTTVIIPSTQPAAPTVVGGTVAEFTIDQPSESNLDQWQYRWRLLDGGWFESGILDSTDPDDTRAVVSGDYEVQVRYDPIGAVGFSVWSLGTSITVISGVPVRDSSRDINSGDRFLAGRRVGWRNPLVCGQHPGLRPCVDRVVPSSGFLSGHQPGDRLLAGRRV